MPTGLPHRGGSPWAFVPGRLLIRGRRRRRTLMVAPTAAAAPSTPRAALAALAGTRTGSGPRVRAWALALPAAATLTALLARRKGQFVSCDLAVAVGIQLLQHRDGVGDLLSRDRPVPIGVKMVHQRVGHSLPAAGTLTLAPLAFALLTAGRRRGKLIGPSLAPLGIPPRSARGLGQHRQTHGRNHECGQRHQIVLALHGLYFHSTTSCS